MSVVVAFDPVKFKSTTRSQWDAAAPAWHRWGPFLGEWLGFATERMLDMACVPFGGRVLDVAAGAGEQTLRAARRIGPYGHVLATDISPAILQYAAREARAAGLANVSVREMDGESLDDLAPEAFDVAISRFGLIYFPDRQKALRGMKRALKPRGRIGALVYSTPEANTLLSIPISVIRRRAQLPPPVPGEPGPFSLGAPGVLEAVLQEAGFRNVVVERIAAPLRPISAAEYVAFERESFGALHPMMSHLSEAARADTWKEIEDELRRFQKGRSFLCPCALLVGAGTK